MPEAERDLNGLPVNPVARAHPAEFIETGISAIDGLHTLVRGQKLPVFSGYGLPGLELATRIAQGARVRGSDEGFVVVFAAIGVTDREAAFVRSRFAEGAALERSVVFLNRAEEPAAERLTCPRAALTAAEYLAFERGLHVLVVLVDMTNYCEALREAGRRPRRGARAARLPGLHVLRPRVAVRTGRAHPRTQRLGDAAPDPLDARRRRHAPDPGRDRLHHRRADRALPRARPHAASHRRSTSSRRSAAS